MLNIVFTGPAADPAGRPIVRADLMAACKERGGIRVLPAVRSDVSILVASRTDTVKARNAADRGITVITYSDFIRTHLRGVKIKRGTKPNRYCDCVSAYNQPQSAKDYTEGLGPDDIL